MKAIFVVFTVCWVFTAIAAYTKKDWYVEIWTSSIQDADTDAGISMELWGENGEKDERRLDNDWRDNYEKGKVDVFKYKSKNIGDLKKVVITNDFKDEDGWHVSKVVVEDTKEGKRYEWTPNTWLLRGKWYSTTLELPVYLTEVCDPGWSFNPQSGTCLRYFKANSSYDEARDNCMALGGRLAMPKKVHDNEFLYNFKDTSRDIWIGLTKRAKECTFVWDDGNPLGRTTWLKAPPCNIEADRDCVSLAHTMYSSREPEWHETPCEKTMDYVCEINRVCDPNSKSCYSYFPVNSAYYEARGKCTSLGGQLPMPKTEEENAFLYSIKPPSSKIWIGLTDWRREGTFVWDDGQPPRWTNWNKNEPNDASRSEDCTMMRLNKATWYDIRCWPTWREITYFCQKKNAYIKPTATVTTTTEASRKVTTAPDTGKVTIDPGKCFPTKYTLTTKKNLIHHQLEKKLVPGDEIIIHGVTIDDSDDFYFELAGDCCNYHNTSDCNNFVCDQRLEIRVTTKGLNKTVAVFYPCEVTSMCGDILDMKTFPFKVNQPYVIKISFIENNFYQIYINNILYNVGAINDRFSGGVASINIFKVIPNRQTNITKFELKSLTAPITEKVTTPKTTEKVITASQKDWYIEFLTGDIKNADSDARIEIQLFGTNGQMEKKRRLDHLEKDDFERGNKDAFEFQAHNIGDLKKVKIWNNAHGDDPSWHLSKVIVKDMKEGRTFEWTPNTWLWKGFGWGRDFEWTLELLVEQTEYCDPGWSFNLLNPSCFKYFRANSNYDEARNHCISLGGRLAMPKTIEDNVFLYNLKDPSREIWIGLTDRAKEGEFVWEDGYYGNYLGWSSWLKEYPDYTEDDGDCAQMAWFKYDWYESPCEKTMDYICEIDRVCVSNSKFCYKYVSNKRVYLAKKHCTSLGGHLSMPKTEEENAVLYSLKPYSIDIWIGLTDSRTYGTFVWDDGYALDWRNWGSGQPLKKTDRRSRHWLHCAAMQKLQPSWSVDYCNTAKSYFCQTKNETFVTALTTGFRVKVIEDIRECNFKLCTEGKGCLVKKVPCGRELPKLRCYKINSTANLKWTDAETKCKSMGGFLAEFTDLYSIDYVEKHVWEKKVIYIGGTDQEKEGSWVWKNSGKPVTIDKWTRNNPSGGTRQNCMTWWRDEGWDDDECHVRHGYLCQKDRPNGGSCDDWLDDRVQEKVSSNLNTEKVFTVPSTCFPPKYTLTTVEKRTSTPFIHHLERPLAPGDEIIVHGVPTNRSSFFSFILGEGCCQEFLFCYLDICDNRALEVDVVFKKKYKKNKKEYYSGIYSKVQIRENSKPAPVGRRSDLDLLRFPFDERKPYVIKISFTENGFYEVYMDDILYEVSRLDALNKTTEFAVDGHTNITKFEIKSLTEIKTTAPIQKGTTAPITGEVCLTPSCHSLAKEVLKRMDTTVDPCDKFYQFSCGGWLQQHKIPDDDSEISILGSMEKNSWNNARSILEEKSTSDENPALTKAKKFYKSCIDIDEINKRGDQHFKDFVRTNINGRKPFDLTEALITSHRYNLRPIVELKVSPDEQNSSRNLLYINKPKLGMENSLFNKTRNDTILKSYETYIYKVAEILGFPNNLNWDDVADIVDFEIQIAKSSEIEKNETDDTSDESITLTLAELHGNYSTAKFNFDVFIKHFLASPGIAMTNITDSELVVNYKPSYFQSLKDLITATSSKIIANYVTWRFTQHFLEALPQTYRNLTFEHKKVTEGIKKEKPIWKTCYEITNKPFGFVVGKPYVERYFDKQTVSIANEMVKDLDEAFQELLEENEWMDDVTKKHASEKNKAMKFKIGYPPWILNDTILINDFKTYNMTSGDFFQNFAIIQQQAIIKEFQQLRKPNNKKEWLLKPAEVNGGYLVSKNEIVLTAAIMQPPVFSKDLPKSFNYGGIGMVIGHEITHGFDDEGSKFDKDGNKRMWWSNETLAKFKNKTECLVKQYGSYVMKQVDEPVKGKLNLGENIADNGGLKQSFRAYRNWVKRQGHEEKLLPGVNYNHNQLFFISHAQLWCHKMTDEGLSNLLNGPHSPHSIRSIGPERNFEEFSKAFSCPINSPMNPADKCSVW